MRRYCQYNPRVRAARLAVSERNAGQSIWNIARRAADADTAACELARRFDTVATEIVNIWSNLKT